MFDTFSRFYQQWVIERPKTALTLVAVLAVLMACGLPNFKLDASSDSLTLEHDTDLDYFRQMKQRYDSGDFLVITFKPQQDLFSDDSLQLLQTLSDDLSHVEGASGITSMLDVPLLYSPPIALKDMGEPRTILTPGVDRQMAKQEYLHSPIYKNMLLGPDGQTTALLLNLQLDQHYMDMVRQRDTLRLLRDTQGLTPEQQQELEQVSKQFLEYRTAAAVQDHARVQQVRDIVAKYKDRAQIFVGGATMITADMIDFIKSDLKVFGVGVLLFMIVIMALIFRQKRFVVLPIVTCLTSVLMMLGFLSWVDWRLTVISSNFVALLLIISLAINIHLLVRYREYHAAQPQASQAQLVMDTVRFMIKPCLFTTLTTMVAFISLVVSDIRPVIDFGWMMSMGLALSLVLSFVIIPAGLMLLEKGEPRDTADNSARITLLFSRFTERHSHWVLWLSVALALWSAYGISKLEVENRFIDYFHKSTEIYQGMSVIDKNLGGTIGLDIILNAPSSPLPISATNSEVDGADGIDKSEQEPDPFAGGDPFSEADPFTEADATDQPDPFAEPDAFAEEDPFGEADPFSEQSQTVDPQNQSASGTAQTRTASSRANSNNTNNYWYSVAGIQQIRKLHDYLESLPEVGKVQSLATFYQVASDVNNAPLNDFELALIKRSLPAEVSSILIQPYLSQASDAQNTGVQNAAQPDQTRISLRVKETEPSLHRAQLLADIRSTATEQLGFQPQQVQLTGLLVLYNNMLQSLYKSQIVTLGAVFAGILLMFVVLFRSVSLALIAIIPNLLAAAMVLGGMGWAGVPLDMMTITIAAITVGIGVDDTIHYIHRFKTEFAKDGNYIASMHRSHASIGRAMFYTSVIIVVGFSIMAFSRFIPTIYFGLLTGFAMFAAILAALTLLPRLILLFKPLGPELANTEGSHQ